MPHKTVQQVKARAQYFLGDPVGGTFNEQTLHPAFETAWEDLYDFLGNNQLPAVEVIVERTLAAGVTTYAFVDADIANFGGMILLEAKPLGSSVDRWRALRLVTVLPDAIQQDHILYSYEVRGETLYFVGATQAMDLRFTYTATGVAPTSDAAIVAFDGVHKYLAWRTASIAGRTEGYQQWQACEAEADKAKHQILINRVRDLQKTPIQMPAYRVRSGASSAILPWLITEGDGLFSDPFSDIFD